eukprot:5154484-Amphidinium_carterae.1
MELTNACPDDQALAYQPAAMKELAKRAYEMDHSFETPQSTLLVDVVTPETVPYHLRQRKQRIAQEDLSSGLRAEEGIMGSATGASSSGLRAEEDHTRSPTQRVEVPTSSGLRAEGDQGNEEAQEESDVVFETEFDNLAAGRTEGHEDMEVDQDASPKATSEADQSDMTPMDFGGLAITASAA